jgi:glycosyltransferase involved in cell wall biosynthesis
MQTQKNLSEGKLSVVVPVYNAKECLKQMLTSLIENTDNVGEIILVDDCSDEETRIFIDSLRMRDDSIIRLIKTRNPTHSWFTKSVNTGVRLAHCPYIAVCNSDITFSKGWDSLLIKKLETHRIACPFANGKKLDSLIERIDPEMIQGSCFMFEKKYRSMLFPLPEVLVHWYSDRWLADKVNQMSFVGWAGEINHLITQSGKTVKKDEYYKVITKDLVTYEQMTGKKETLIRQELGFFGS